MSAPLLQVTGLRTRFPIRGGGGFRTSGYVRAVDGVDLSIQSGRTLALVGESGSGKTTVGLSILRLVKPYAGEVRFDGIDLLSLSLGEFRQYRRALQVVFQDTRMSLDPGLTIRDAIAEGLNAFGIGANTRERTERVAELMTLVRLEPAMMTRYPSELSGGQRQRVGLARALAVEPRLIVCDEAVSALDVSVQAQVLDLLGDLQNRLGIAYLFITHDLAVARHVAHRAAVMYLGQIVEEGGAEEVFSAPSHPYTQALLDAVPSTDPARRSLQATVQGETPSPANLPSACRFHTRCPHIFDRCREEAPELYRLNDRLGRCFLLEGSPAKEARREVPRRRD